MRVQVVAGLVAGLILVAVPLYLWRRPQPSSIPVADAAVAPSVKTAEPPRPVVPVPVVETAPPSIRLSPFSTIKCQSAGPGRTPPERCDHVTFFEEALSRAIRENASCAPPLPAGGDLSYVLELDFQKKKLNLFQGKSSTIKRDKSKELLRCVRRALPTPDWSTVPHQHSKYKVSVLASYPPSQSF